MTITNFHDGPIYLTSPTSISTDWQCGMKYWWYKCEGGNGIVPIEEASYFAEGRELHHDLEPYARGGTVEQVLEGIPSLQSVAPSQTDLELLSRRRGWAVAFGEFIEPTLRDGHDEVSVEEEIVLQRDPLWVNVRPDRVQRSHATRGLRYREWKSTSSTRPEWVLSWAHHPQLHLGIVALEEELKEKVDYANVLGFYKGYPKEGKLLHPYIYAYHSPQGVWSDKYTYGWEKVGVWDYPDGVEGWVRKCGPEVAQKVFIWSAPCFADHRMVEQLLRRRAERQKEIDEVKTVAQVDRDVRESHFEMRLSQCRPAYGSACGYLAACKNAVVNADPVGSGLYVNRTHKSDTEESIDGEADRD